MSVSLIDGHIDDDVLTDEQIIKALECCLDASPSTCKNCPLFNATNSTMVCSKIVTKFAFDLINRQQAEIERLKDLNKCYYTSCQQIAKSNHEIKTEAVKEFAKELKEKYSMEIDGYYGEVVFHCDIDNLVKERVGES